MDLLVVLQTHTLGDSQHALNKPRYCGAPKSEVSRRCVTSLVHTMNAAITGHRELRLRLMVLDDHSEEGFLEFLATLLAQARFPTEVRSLQTRGIMPSILACYRFGLEHGREWVYFAQDDYLYEDKAIGIMAQVAMEFSRNLGAPASIYPFNDPFRYLPQNVGEKVHLVRGVDRHWRTNYHTASCFMTHHQVLRDNWDLFLKMGTSELSGDMEDQSINQLFISRHYQLFTPIPSLALHMQYDTEIDPLMNWQAWWERFSPAATPNQGEGT